AHCFNGAALFQARKSRATSLRLRRLKGASMGPRFFKRGNYSPGSRCLIYFFSASMGPRFFKRGNRDLTTRSYSIFLLLFSERLFNFLIIQYNF
ncbi:MAG: hypothetical protein ACP5T0_00995, partial [Verrucomicrobiia bacterium]